MLKAERLQILHRTDKALELLEIIINGNQHLKIKDLAERLRVGKEEVLLLLVTMESRGLVAWDSNRKIYRPVGEPPEITGNVGQNFAGSRMPSSATAVS